MKKFVALFLAVMVSVSALSFTGCKKDVEKIDETKTQLYVSNFDAGIGRTWIEALGDAFETDFATYSFEEGKTGVQVIIDHNRTDSGAKLLADIGASSNHVFFTEGCDYVAMSKSGLRDVTSIMTQGAITGVDASGNFTRESATIESKISPEFLSYLNRGSDSDKEYYAFPYYLCLSGFLFDVDLWNSNYYYYAKSGCPSEYVADAIATDGDVEGAIEIYKDEIETFTHGNAVWVNDQGKTKEGSQEALSAGPDGQYNTFDDGMPATYDEFYALMNKMVADGIIPLVWTGKYAGYADRLTNAMWWAAEGEERLDVYYSLNGTHDQLVKLDDNGEVIYQADGVTPQTESVTFSGGRDNGYEIQRSLAKYYALQFADKVATTDSWVSTSDCYSGSVSHIQAQSAFITSVNSGGKRIAMLADGGWWQQESAQTFEIMAGKDAQYSKERRSFSMLCPANPTIERLVERGENGIKNTVVQSSDCYCLINGNLKEGSAQLLVAETFMSYVNNEKCLNIFTEKTNMSRGLNYEVNEETYAKLTPYGKNLIDFTKATNVVYPYSNNSLFHNNYQYLSNKPEQYNWHSLITSREGLEPFYPITQLHDSANRTNGLNGKSYFEGLINYYENNVWKKLI